MSLQKVTITGAETPPTPKERLVREIRDAVAQLDIPHVGRPGDLYSQAIDSAVKAVERVAKQHHIEI